MMLVCSWFSGPAAMSTFASAATERLVDHRPGVADPDDLAGELERAIARLRPDYRVVFVLFHEQNLSHEEIAQTIQRPIGTIKTWLRRARAELAVDLARRGVSREA